MIGPMIRAMRPKQYLKNVLVFAAPGAAGVLDEAGDLGITVIAFLSFCFAASGIYVWNDISDVEADRAHPTKRNRPIAAGLVSMPVARTMGVLLPILALALAAATGMRSSQVNEALPARMIMRTPTKPAMIAAQRRGPTFSPSIRADITVTKSGMVKVMQTTSASGMAATAR